MRTDKRFERGEKTRQTIIDAATAIIIEQGKKGLTTRAICERAGIGKGSLYHHFTDTHQIIVAVIRNFLDHYFSAMTAQNFTSVHDFFLKFGEQAISEIVEHMSLRERFLPFFEEISTDSEIVIELLEKSSSVQKELIRKLGELAGGEVPHDVLQNMVLALITFLEGMEHLIFFTRDAERFHTMWHCVAKMLADHVIMHTKRRVLCDHS